MDSQEEGYAYYANLLQEGSLISDEIVMESPTQVKVAAKKPRAGNFTLEEDNLLVSAWLNISLDAVSGNEQKHKTYWNRVWEYFHKYKNFNSERNANSLMNRWSTVQLGTNKFCGYYAQIESLNQSGATEQDKISRAKLMYQEFQKVTFQFEHCWNALRYQPKWLIECAKKQPKKSKTSKTSSPSTPESINLEEDGVSHDAFVDLERPIGRKAEKERLKKRKSQDSTTSNLAGILNEIKDEKKKANEKKMEILEKACIQEQERNHIEQERYHMKQEHEKERLRIKEEKIRAEQLKEEERIMMIDTSGMSQMQQEYYHHRQIEIIERRRGNK